MTEKRAHPGRPEDPEITPRVINAARRVFARHGWSGFTMERVATEARVGKAALYRRWPGKLQLLEAVYATTSDPYVDIDTGNLAEDLLLFARALIMRQDEDHMLFFRRLEMEARAHPELFADRVIEIWRTNQRLARRLVQRAIERGELPESTEVGVLLDDVHGIVATHLGASSPATRARIIAEPDGLAQTVADFVLHAFVAHPFRA
jgi:AcrR family transcriptional regulator